jgi:hypothetical protein
MCPRAHEDHPDGRHLHLLLPAVVRRPAGHTNASFMSGGSGASTSPASTCTASRMDGLSLGSG